MIKEGLGSKRLKGGSLGFRVPGRNSFKGVIQGIEGLWSKLLKGFVWGSIIKVF